MHQHRAPPALVLRRSEKRILLAQFAVQLSAEIKLAALEKGAFLARTWKLSGHQQMLHKISPAVPGLLNSP
jgi:hypothetical protein